MKNMSSAAAEQRSEEIFTQGIIPRMLKMTPSDFVNICFSVSTRMMLLGLGTVAIMNDELLDKYTNALLDKVLEVKKTVESEAFDHDYIMAPFREKYGCKHQNDAPVAED